MRLPKIGKTKIIIQLFAGKVVKENECAPNEKI